MDEVTTHAITFLIGTATGAAGNYFAQKYTDKRRKKEAVVVEDSLFLELKARMPDLFEEMRTDLINDEYSEWREFFVIPKDVMCNFSGNSFHYEDDGVNLYLSGECSAIFMRV